ncbi:MAG: tetratricopeptide repeat protein, partial [Pseudomonadota bacterium]
MLESGRQILRAWVLRTCATSGGTAVLHVGGGNVQVSKGSAIPLEIYEATTIELARLLALQDLRELDTTDLSNRVEAALRSGDLWSAEKHAEELVQREADNARSASRAYRKAKRAYGKAASEEALAEQIACQEAGTAQAAAQAYREAERTDREAARKRARAVALQGDLCLMRLEYEKASDLFREAVACLKRDDPDAITYLRREVIAQRRAGDLSAALDAADEAVSRAGKMGREAAHAYGERARVRRELGAYARALDDNRRAQDLLKSVDPTPGQEAEALRVEEAGRLTDLGDFVYSLRVEEAGLLTDMGDCADALWIEEAGLLTDMGDYADARAILDHVSSRLDGDSREYRSYIAQVLHFQGRLRLEEGHFTEASELLEKALGERMELVGSDHPNLIRARSDYAYALRRVGRLDEADTQYRKAQAAFLRVFDEEVAEYATVLDHIAGLRFAMGKKERARELYKQAINLAERTLGRDHPDVGQSLNNLALLQHRDGRPEEALKLLLRAVAIFESSLGAAHLDTATALSNLSGAQVALGDAAAAEQSCCKALNIRQGRLGKNHPTFAESLMQLAQVRHLQGRLQDALDEQTRAVSILRGKILRRRTQPNRIKPEEIELARALADLARFLLERDEPDPERRAKGSASRAAAMASSGSSRSSRKR